ncbi:aminodeoxychorismate/anthranilate synthase component II [Atopobacter sp. AH10]|uniref:anthranilate synthase component II n=1 Tax=Atopobacter sp. AH10 TaxID=2315861 RepID=UPI000EF1E297|nr:aminodeoxychorismate/anthranilate synthase component II [Atopobacter sp. AH10]RLK63341.1 aminodeoxychorismate/anthranilate synthase component II [Atopobacter sp. AH10]
MYYILDNYDSFVYNLSAYMQELGQEVLVKRADEMDLTEIETLKPEGIILSPGPKRPEDAIESQKVIEKFKNKIPILGVCLGHQTIGLFFGADVVKGSRPLHGKITRLKHDGKGLFRDLPQNYQITHYHSLVVLEESLPESLKVTAFSEDGSVMGLQHRHLPIYGVQFHPEAILTEYGHELLANFQLICKSWRKYHAVD